MTGGVTDTAGQTDLHGAPLPVAAVRDLVRIGDALRDAAPVCVAVSGGVDSSLVLFAAVRRLGGDQVLAFTSRSPLAVPGEVERAADLARRLGSHHEIVAVDLLTVPRVAANAVDRCYHCKARILDEMAVVAARHGVATLVDGTNADDVRDDRPGLRAADERGVVHPLLAAGMGKSAVRALAHAAGLPMWEAPAQACLATRIPFGETLTTSALRQVAAAESALHDLGFAECRVRRHGDLARVELPPDAAGRAVGAAQARIVARLRRLGFTYVTLDLGGLRGGSMSEAATPAGASPPAPAAGEPAPE